MTWPRILHRIWLDEEERPEFAGWRDRLGELHPDWEIRTWADSAELTWLRHAESFSELLKTDPFGRAPDLLRYELLWRFGGVYIDTDFEPLRALDELLEDPRPFAAWESERTMCTALLAAPPEHPAIGVLLDGVAERLRVTQGKPANAAIGPEYATELWREREDVRRLPPWTFYPVGWWERQRLGGPYPERTYAVHHWAAGWKEKPVPAPAQVRPRGSASGLSVLVAFRDVDGSRSEVFDLIRSMFEVHLPDAELVVATDDGEDPFHKTLALNRAAAAASGDILGIWDADTWVPPAQVHDAVAFVKANPTRWARPWRQKLKVNEAGTRHILGLDGWDGTIDHRRFGRPENVNSFWAAPPLIVPRAAFDAVGGMDERFRGWGFEDVAFATALTRVVGRPRVGTGTCLHLWHPRVQRTGNDLWPGQDSQKENHELLRAYRNARTTEEMRQVIEMRGVSA